MTRDNLILEVLSFIHAHSFYEEVDESWFDDLALKIFHYQKRKNTLLKKFWSPLSPKKTSDIFPFPMDALKYVHLGEGDHFFASSSTSSGKPSRHFFMDDVLYKEQLRRYFPQVFPSHAIINLLEFRPNWSLFRMMEHLEEIKGEKKILVGTSKNHCELLLQKKKIQHHIDTLFDTGGFKNFLSPYNQEELYRRLCSFYDIDISSIRGEYGMTELFSQAYDITFEFNSSKRIKRTIPTLRCFQMKNSNNLAFIDLCNIDSCAFMLTSDVGHILNKREFTLEGRMQNSALKGCSLR